MKQPVRKLLQLQICQFIVCCKTCLFLLILVWFLQVGKPFAKALTYFHN